MSINIAESPEIFGVFETAQFDRSKRQQVYQQSEISSYQSGQRISFSMPPISSDMRNMYMEYGMQLLNITPETPQIINIRSYDPTSSYSAVAPTAGSFDLSLWGIRINIAYNATKGSIIDSLNAIVQTTAPIKSITFTLVSPQLPTDLFSASGSLNIMVSDFQSLDLDSAFDIRVTGSLLLDTGTPLSVVSEITQLGVPQYPKYEMNASSIIRRCEIELNSQTFSECDDVNVLKCAILDKCNVVEWYNTVGRIESNTGIANTWTGQKRFSLYLGDVFGILEHYYPLHLVPGIQLRINIYLEDPDRCLIQGVSGGGDYIVYNPELHYHSLKLSDTMQRRFMDRINGDGLVYGFTSYQNLTDVLVANATEKDVITNFNFSRFTGILAVMREQSYINDATNSFKMSSTIRNNIGSYRLKIGTQYYPRDRVDLLGVNEDVVEPFREFMRFYNLAQNSNSYAGLNYEANDHAMTKLINHIGDIVPPSFIMAISTDPHQNEDYTHNHSSGVDVSGQTNVSLELRGVQPQDTNIINIFARYNAYAVIQRNQSIYIR